MGYLPSIEPHLDVCMERLDDIEPYMDFILQHIEVFAPNCGPLIKHLDALLPYAKLRDEGIAEEFLPYMPYVAVSANLDAVLFWWGWVLRVPGLRRILVV